MAKSTKKLEILKEKAKELQTTHWDLDYIPKKLLDDLYSKGKRKRNGSINNASRRLGLHWLIIAGFGLVGLLLIVVLFL